MLADRCKRCWIFGMDTLGTAGAVLNLKKYFFSYVNKKLNFCLTKEKAA